MINLYNALQIVIKRSRAHWRLLSSIAIGVVVAVAILASTPLYSNALNDLGLQHALAQKSAPMMDLDVYSSNNLIDRKEFDSNTTFISQQIDYYVGNLIHQTEISMTTQSFSVMVAGNIIPTDSTRPQGYFQSYSNLEQHVKLLEGRFPKYAGEVASQEQLAALGSNTDNSIDTLIPKDLTNPDLEIEGVLSPHTADLMHAKVGDRLIFFIEGRGGDPVTINIRLVGLIEPIDSNDEFWFLKKDVFDASTSNGIVVPLFVPQESIFGIIGSLYPKAKISYHWYFYVDQSRIDSTKAKYINSSIDTAETGITTQITNASVFTGLNLTISEYLQKQLFTTIPLYLLVFQIAAIIFYYIATVASMVIEQETGEIALLRSRGASTFQIFGIFLIEGTLISALGGIIGPLLGASVFGLLGKTGPFMPLTGGGLLPIRFTPIVFVLTGVATGLCLIAFMIPAIQASRRGILHHRQMITRPPSTPVWQKFYLDIVFLIVGGGLYYELRQRGSLLTQKLFGDLGVDPLMLITPLLFMLAVAIIFLRLFPLLVKATSKLSRYITSPVFTLTLRYMARNPIHYSRLILLLMMAASVGMFSASFLGTLNRSYIERVEYKTGSDVRLVNPQTYDYGKNAMSERYSKIDGVDNVSLVFRSSATVGTFTQTDGEILAVDPGTFGSVTWYRKDFSQKTVSEMMAILDKDKIEKSGILLPDGIEAIGAWIAPVYSSMSQSTMPSQLSSSLSSFSLVARIEDSRGIYSDINLGSLQYYDWQYIEGSLANSAGNFPVSPVRLLCIYISGSGGMGMGSNLQGIYLDDLQVRGTSFPNPVIIEDFEDISEWTALSESSGGGNARLGTSDSLICQNTLVYGGNFSARYTWNNQRVFRGIFANYNSEPLSAIASRSFLNTVGISVGDSIIIRIPGQFVNVNIEGEVDYFPTLYPDQKPFLILNYDRLSSAGIASNNRLYPNEAWLGLSQDTQKRAQAIKTLQTSAYHSDTFYDRQALIDAQKSDPLVAAGWAGILLIAFVGVVVVSGLGFIVYAYLAARSRHLEFAILRTLGFSWKQIISLVCLEQIFVIGLGMGIGTLLGSRLSRIMMPFLQLTEKGETVVPPFTIVTDWSTIGIAYIILTIAFIITMSLVVLFFSRVALYRALRMGEE
jgi:ABC-type antimicrobial peptide transport system permease subunit